VSHEPSAPRSEEGQTYACFGGDEEDEVPLALLESVHDQLPVLHRRSAVQPAVGVPARSAAVVSVAVRSDSMEVLSRASAPFAADEVLDDVEHARCLRENQHFVPFGLPLSEQQLQNPQLAWLSERNGECER